MPQKIPPRKSHVEFGVDEVEQSIQRHFEQQAYKFAGSVAIKSGRESLTYHDLNATANRLAWALLEREDGRKGAIGLLLAQGAPFVIALLGTLKAGKAFVPMDPQLPARRLAFLAEHAAVEWIITDRGSLALARSLLMEGQRVFNIEELDDRWPADDPDLGTDPGSMSHILYISGSTGTPKGVVQRHRNALHSVMRLTNKLQIGSDERLTWLAPGGTAQAVNNIFLALLNGGCLFPFNVRDDGLARMANWLYDEEITFYYSCASVFRIFVETLGCRQRLPRLRAIRLDGEPVTVRDIERLKKHLDADCVFVNSLASTEACGTYRINLVDKDSTFTETFVPVGYPVEGMTVLLLDEEGRRVRDGEIGEIAIQSRYLSPGYWEKGRLDCSAFPADPSGGEETLFRTGDLGRMEPGERLDFLGRTDSQFKVRGYRVELAEIEMRLLALDTVREAVVIAERDELGDHHLTAFVVLAERNASTADAIRQYLTSELPDYMVPGKIIVIDALPLTPGGKIDGGALAAWQAPGDGWRSSFVAPCTPTERALAKIWGEVLGHGDVSLNHRFVEVGGTSLRATQVAARVMTQLGVELTGREILDAQALRTLSAFVARRMSEQVNVRDRERPAADADSNGSLPLLEPPGSPTTGDSPMKIDWSKCDQRCCAGAALTQIDRGPCDRPPLSCAQERLWFLAQLEKNLTAYTIANAWRLTGPLDVERLRLALETIVLRHEPLRSVFGVQDGQPYLNVLPPGIFELAVHDLRHVPGAEHDKELARHATADAERAFDLTRDLGLRAQVLWLSDEDHVLLLCQHQIASDGWS